MDSTIVSGVWQGHLGRGLAPRELQFLLSIASGSTPKQIAREFGVEHQTVHKRMASIMFKLQVNRAAAAVAEAMRRQIITPLCVVLATLIAIHSTNDDMRRERKSSERRVAVFEVKLARKAAHKSRPCISIA